MASLPCRPLRLRFAPRHPSRSAARSFGALSALPLVDRLLPAPLPWPFALSSEALRDVALAVLDRARRNGADQADAEVTQGNGLNVTVRLGTGDAGAQRRQGAQRDRLRWRPQGNASSGDFSPDAVNAAGRQGADHRQIHQPDPFAGLADASLMADIPDLDLYHPLAIDANAAIAIAKRCEDAGRFCCR